MRALIFLNLLWLISCGHQSRDSIFRSEKSVHIDEDFSFLYKNSSLFSPFVKLCLERKVEKGLEKITNLYQGNSQKPEYWNAMGICVVLNGRVNQGILYFQQALSLSSQNSKVINNLAITDIILGKHTEAYSKFGSIQKLKNKDPSSMVNFAYLYLKFKQRSKALKILTRLKRSNYRSERLTTCLRLAKRANS